MGSTIQWRDRPEDRSNRSSGEIIQFGKRKDAGRGYMAHSERVGPAVLVLHEFFGLQPSFEAYADRLNAEGFTVLVPDLYDGVIATSVEEAGRIAQSLDVPATIRKLRAAASFLTDNWHPRLGVVGFSLGADFAVALANEISVEGVVLYYGLGDVDSGEWRGPTLGHFAENDEWTPAADAEKAFAALEEAGVEAEMHVYPGTGHWFANASVPEAYRADAVDAAFHRTAESFTTTSRDAARRGSYPLSVVRRRPGIACLLAAAVVVAAFSLAHAEDVPAQSIPQNPDDVSRVPKFVGSAATPHRIRSFSVPQNPFMAPDPDNNIHDDAYMTDAYERAGPLGRRMKVSSTFQGAECASALFDKDGRILTICVGGQGPTLLMIDPKNLATKASLPLPPRSGGGTGSTPFNDFSGGGYFYLDNEYRVVTPTNNRQIWIIEATEGASGPAFEVVEMFDLSGVVAPGEGIVSALPDWNGLIWFVTTRGQVGTVDPATAAVAAVQLEGEIIGNSFAIDETGGVYVVSDHALYRFDATEDGAPAVTWRKRYARGTEQKPGQVTQGSGTTPTLLGRKYVAITDNGDPRMHVVVYRRGPHAARRKVCAQAVFKKGKGATENSLIGVGKSLIVENNYGYSGPTATENGASTEPGIARVDFSGGRCRTVWTSAERSPSVVPKASLSTGLVYVYSKKPRKDEVDAWYLTALDFRTGETVYKRLAGTGLGYNNNYAPITLGPNGAAYVGALGGLVKLRDR